MISFFCFSWTFADGDDGANWWQQLIVLLWIFLNFCQWWWILLAKAAWLFLSNQFIFGETLWIDGILWDLWNIVKNLSNFGLWFLFLYQIIHNLLSIKEQFKFDFFKKLFIAGIGIQISWFACATILDISTVWIAWVSWLSTQVLNQENVLDKQFSFVNGDNIAERLQENNEILGFTLEENGSVSSKYITVKNVSEMSKDDIKNALYDSFLPSQSDFSWPLTFIGLSLLNFNPPGFQNQIESIQIQQNQDTTDILKTVIDLMFLWWWTLILYTITMLFLLIISLIRVFILQWFIVLSPLLILLSQFDDIPLFKDTKTFKIGKFFSLVFWPVFVVLGLTLIQFVIATMLTAIPIHGSFSFNELQCEAFAGTASSCTIGDYASFVVNGLTSTLGQIIRNLFIIFFCWILIKFALKGFGSWWTGIEYLDKWIDTWTELVENSVLNAKLVPLPWGVTSIKALDAVKKDLNKKLNTKFDTVDRSEVSNIVRKITGQPFQWNDQAVLNEIGKDYTAITQCFNEWYKLNLATPSGKTVLWTWLKKYQQKNQDSHIAKFFGKYSNVDNFMEALDSKNPTDPSAEEVKKTILDQFGIADSEQKLQQAGWKNQTLSTTTQ